MHDRRFGMQHRALSSDSKAEASHLRSISVWLEYDFTEGTHDFSLSNKSNL